MVIFNKNPEQVFTKKDTVIFDYLRKIEQNIAQFQ